MPSKAIKGLFICSSDIISFAMEISREKRLQIVALFNSSQMTYRAIANQTGVGLATVADIIKLWKDTGDVISRRFGRPSTNRVLTERSVRQLVRQSIIDPRATARQIRDRVGGEVSQVSVRTVQRYLQLNDLIIILLQKSTTRVKAVYSRTNSNGFCCCNCFLAFLLLLLSVSFCLPSYS
jgi:transposase